MGTFRHFTDIQAWVGAREVAVAVYRLGTPGPLERDFGMRDQIRRASVSIMANIAEGFGRGGDKEFSRFLDIARGSGSELESHLLLIDVIYPTLQAETAIIREQLDRCLAMIAKLTTYLRSTGLPDSRTSGLPD